MPSARLTLREEDVVRLTLEFLHNRELHISQLSLERETGVINGCFSDDLLFLRQLILDGQWDDVLEFIQPLEALPTFDMRKFTYIILSHKYVELLCIKSEANVQGSSVDNAVEEVVKVLNELEKFAPSKEEYSGMCLLLTLPRLTDHLQYKDWNPSNARVHCFREVYPLVAEFLPGDKKNSENLACAKNDRLIQLIIKGVLYESCVNYCQAKATGSKESQSQEMSFAKLLDGTVGFSDSDLSLLSWLQSIPSETFSVPFEQRTLNVDVERLDRPSLETSWTEHMLITPIKPKTFPHSAMPFTRPRSAADIMSRSLMPALDSYSSGPGSANPAGNPRSMVQSMGDMNINSPMSRSSFASFHLTGMKNNKQMNSSVDRLFENEGDVFLSNSYAEFQQLPSIQEQASTPKVDSSSASMHSQNSKSPERKVSAASTPEHKGRDSPASLATSRSSRRDSLNEKPSNQSVALSTQNVLLTAPAEPILEQSFTGDLLKEFQKQKQKLQETLAAREKEREELIKQLHSHDNKAKEERQYVNKTLVNGSAVHPAKSSSKPNINGNVDHYRAVSKPVETTPGGHIDVIYDTVKAQTGRMYGYPKSAIEGRLFAAISDQSIMGTVVDHSAAMRRLEALFDDVKLDRRSPPKIFVASHTANCNLHKKLVSHRGSVASGLNNVKRRDAADHHKNLHVSFVNGVGPRRESMPALNYTGNYRRRESLGLPNNPPVKTLEHPSNFPSTLRKDPMTTSTGSISNVRRDSLGGSMNRLKKDNLQVPRRNSRRLSNDSLDSSRRNSWDPFRRGSLGSGGWEDTLHDEDRKKPVSKPSSVDTTNDSNGSRPRFVAVTTLEDVQAVRCAEFHPGGQLYAVGSNSKTLRICAYPKLSDLREDHQTYQPMVLFKRTKHHKGSIYCLAWSPMGDLMATGSNDKTVKLMRFNSDTSNLEGEEIELSMHDGTVRDLCFLEDTSNKSSLLISGGAGDCKIYVTDCATGTPFQALSGHTGHILSLYTWGGAMFVSGSHDKTVRFWDLRTRGCVNLVTPCTIPGTRQGSPVASLCVDPSGRLLVSGHEDSSCVLYDIRGGRCVQAFKPHSADVRSIRFSPSAYYLLTGGYDNKLVLTDLQGDLTLPLPSVVVAQHQDKVISGRWHPSEFSFLSTSADKTATLWALPPV